MAVVTFVAGCIAVGAPSIVAAETSPVVNQVDLTGPVGSERFGEIVTVLPNGNYVVVDSHRGVGAGSMSVR